MRLCVAAARPCLGWVEPCRSRAPASLCNGFRNPPRALFAPFLVLLGTPGHCAWAFRGVRGARGARLCVAAARPCLGWVWPCRSRAPASLRNGFRNSTLRARLFAPFLVRLGTPCYALGRFGGRGGRRKHAFARLRPGRAWAAFGPVAPGPLLVFVTGSETAVPAPSARAFSLHFWSFLGTPCHCAWGRGAVGGAPLRGCGPAVPGLGLALSLPDPC